MSPTRIAKQKLNELIKREDFECILSIEIHGCKFLMYLSFTRSICTIDGFGKVIWL